MVAHACEMIPQFHAHEITLARGHTLKRLGGSEHIWLHYTMRQIPVIVPFILYTPLHCCMVHLQAQNRAPSSLQRQKRLAASIIGVAAATASIYIAEKLYYKHKYIIQSSLEGDGWQNYFKEMITGLRTNSGWGSMYFKSWSRFSSRRWISVIATMCHWRSKWQYLSTQLLQICPTER